MRRGVPGATLEDLLEKLLLLVTPDERRHRRPFEVRPEPCPRPDRTPQSQRLGLSFPRRSGKLLIDEGLQRAGVGRLGHGHTVDRRRRLDPPSGVDNVAHYQRTAPVCGLAEGHNHLTGADPDPDRELDFWLARIELAHDPDPSHSG